MIQHRQFCAAAFALSLGSPVQAEGLCNTLGDLLAFAGAEQIGAKIEITKQSGSATCTLARSHLMPPAAHCNWAYPFRSPQATGAFEALFDEVAVCLGPDATPTSDDGVNHPDTYDLRRFEGQGMAVDVSLKDKGALQQSYVFLKVGPLNP